MPELPEVETIRRDLAKTIVGKKIAEFQVLNKKSAVPGNIAKRLKNLKINKVDRRAKLLIFELSNGEFLLIHLKLTGQLIYQASESDKFTRAIFIFTDKSRLFFNDLRKFGYIKLATAKESEKIKNEYGVEPLSKEFSLEKFAEILARRPKMKIKQLLMEQGLIAGLGNIYADEACFAAGVRPMRKAGGLSSAEVKKIWQAIPEILKKAIDKRGTSADTYVDGQGREGKFENYLMVYGRGGEKCEKCETKIVKIKLGGRGAHFCPRCQK